MQLSRIPFEYQTTIQQTSNVILCCILNPFHCTMNLNTKWYRTLLSDQSHQGMGHQNERWFALGMSLKVHLAARFLDYDVWFWNAPVKLKKNYLIQQNCKNDSIQNQWKLTQKQCHWNSIAAIFKNECIAFRSEKYDSMYDCKLCSILTLYLLFWYINIGRAAADSRFYSAFFYLVQ